MSMTDPIADMLTRIRNANRANKERVEIPASRAKLGVARILKEQGFIRNYRFLENRQQGTIRVYLKYSPEKERVITDLKRISKPSRRVYVGWRDMPRVLGGLGIAIVSTPEGLMTASRARRAKVGGEILCYVW